MIVLMVFFVPAASRFAAAMMSPMYASMAPDENAASRSCADWNSAIFTSESPSVEK